MTISASTPQRVVVLLIAIALALVLLLAGAVTAGATGTATPEVAASVQHTVVVGDTLWDIAAVYTDPGDDVRDTIYDIRQANAMADSVVRVGEVLLIPLEF